MNIQIRNYNKFVLKMQKKLKNMEVCIISNNCIGGVLYHDLGLKFNSPTINTLIYGQEFIDFVENIKEFLNCELMYDKSSKEYPIGILSLPNEKIVHVHFLHNNNFEEAKLNWDRRKIRVDFDNLFIIYEHFNKYDDSILDKLDKLDLQKVIFTHKKFKHVKSSKYIRACRKEKSFGTILKFKNRISGRRNLYDYNIIKHINKMDLKGATR